MAVQAEWLEKDYYKVLGVAQSATEQEITRAYRKLAKQYHPDANPGSEDRFKEISAAYDVVGDEDRRREYDEMRRMGPMAGGMPGGFGGPGGNFRMDDLGDVFGGLFGQSGRRQRRRAERGADLEGQVHLSFVEAVNGVTTTVSLPSQDSCATCKGSGSAPGSETKVCDRCQGLGQIQKNQGMFSIADTCDSCGGRGQVTTKPCSSCRASGRVASSRQVKVAIPSGVEGGKRIRVPGRGEPGSGGGPAGDLFVVVHVRADARFGRKGRHLTVNLPISFPEAVLGTTVKVPTLDGSVTLKIPAGSSPGKQLRVAGRGVPSSKAHPQAGDLLVKLELEVPTETSEEFLAAVKALAEVSPEAQRDHLEEA